MEIRLDNFLAFFIHGDADNGEAFRAVLFLELDEPGSFDFAGLAPGGPEIQKDDFAAEVGELQFLALEVLKHQIADADGAVLRTGGRGGAGYGRGDLRQFAIQDEDDDDQYSDGDTDCENLLHMRTPK